MRGIKDKFAVAYFYVFDKKKKSKTGFTFLPNALYS